MNDKQKILVVDDNTTNIRFIADALKELDYVSIVYATRGLKAIEILNSSQIDLILMDINMPQMDGFETVKKMDTDIPVIFVTALDDSKSILKAFENGGVDYITKPFYPSELIARVTTHLRLAKLNKNLQSEVKKEVEKNRQKEKIIARQAKFAALGEMIDAIAHQWKQPLNLINMHTDLVLFYAEQNDLTKEHIDRAKEKISKNMNHLVNTLDEFRTFFRPNKNIETFDIKTACEKVLLLVEDEFSKNNVKVEIKEQNSFSIKAIENEFKHLILNILNNAKDAFNDNNIDIKKREITIEISSDEKNEYIQIIDNAGGIPIDIIDNIFKANITTKTEDKGTGIGLYLSSQIAQKYNGKLEVKNLENGAVFTYSQTKGSNNG